MRVLLLNPPGDKPYLRDYYCSHTAKASYYWHPYDLVVQSGILSTQHEVEYLDANLLRYSKEKAAAQIKEIQPEAIVFLTGGVCWKNDLEFMDSLDIPKSVPVIGTGDVLVSKGREFMQKYPWLSGVLLNFTSDAARLFLQAWDKENGPRTKDPIPNLLYRNNGEFVRGVDPGHRAFAFPIPRYDLIPMRKYSIPHGRRGKFASFLTDFGCPFNCSFCFNGKWAHKIRNVDNALQELRYLKKIGIHELWIKDLTFGVTKSHSKTFLHRLIEEDLGFEWITLSRVDVMDEEILTLMARAGCHTIQFGVESADQQILNSIDKRIAPERVKEIFQLCRQLGIRTLAHFIIGLPGETEESAKNTIDFAIDLDPDFASFNMAAPRMGTDLRAEAISQGWTNKDVDSVDNSIALPQMEIGTLSSQRVFELRNEAIRRFHLRPKYLWRKATHWRSLRQLYCDVRNGVTLLQSTVKKPTLQEAMDGEG
ncbi:radical SAM protein [bacterium]|nr:radical SAM protein [bacterium]